MSVDLKTLTPDTSLPTTGFLFGADSQASSTPSVYGTAAVATAVGLQFPAGAQATPSISTTGDNDTGIWFPAANTVAVSTNALERMRITSAGNVGIGTSSPFGRLEVVGAGSTITDARLRISNPNTSSFSTAVLDLYSNGRSRVEIYGQQDGTGNGGYLILNTSDAAGALQERMRITSAGNVGIGTSSPDINLRVSGTFAQLGTIDGTVDNRFISTSGGGAGIVGTYSNHPLAVYTNASERIRITSAGNVGIGTSSPSQKLDVVGAGQFQSNLFVTASAANATFWLTSSGGSGRQYAIFSSTDGSLVTYDSTGVAERMRITSAGNVGIGTSSFGTSAAGVIGIANGTAPTTSPAGMGQLYVEGGALKYRGSSGTVTTIANA